MQVTNKLRIKKICIGVVLYKNDTASIRLMIRSVEHQVGIDWLDIKLVFHSNDGVDRQGEIDLIRSELGLKRLKDIEVTHGPNVGFGAAHNLIARRAHEAGCALYVGANPDGFFHLNALEALVAAAGRHGDEVLLEARQFPQEHPKTYDQFSGATNWVSGACFAINTDYFLFLGGFDENFFMYCEDVDLSWRVKAEGGSCVVVPGALFYHDTSDDREHHWVRIEMLKSGRVLGRKWKSDGFAAAMEDELVRLGFADSRFTLPRLKVEPVDIPEQSLGEIVEFRRLFSFSPARW